MGLEDLKAALLKRMSGGRPTDDEEDAASEAMMQRILGESGKTISNADRARVKTMSGESGKNMSDADLMKMILRDKARAESGRTMSDRDKARPFKNGGKVMGYEDGGAVTMPNTPKKKNKPKMGCVMAGRGGKFKGIT